MSGQTGDQEDRTEAPTARRLQKAQEEGEVPVSREAVLLAGLAAVTVSFLLAEHGLGLSLSRSLSIDPEPARAADRRTHRRCSTRSPSPVSRPSRPSRCHRSSAPRPRPSRKPGSRSAPVDCTPTSAGCRRRKGLKRMFGSDSLVETAKSLAKLLIVGGAIVLVLRGELPQARSPAVRAADIVARTS